MTALCDMVNIGALGGRNQISNRRGINGLWQDSESGHAERPWEQHFTRNILPDGPIHHQLSPRHMTKDSIFDAT
jgi:hypothetical protein